MSVWVEVPSAQEVHRVVGALGEAGREHMPVDDYGFGPFGWVDDRFGVSWQVCSSVARE